MCEFVLFSRDNQIKRNLAWIELASLKIVFRYKIKDLIAALISIQDAVSVLIHCQISLESGSSRYFKGISGHSISKDAVSHSECCMQFDVCASPLREFISQRSKPNEAMQVIFVLFWSRQVQ